MDEPMKLIIDRKLWLRNEPDESYLRRARDGKMCCLGFLAKACGYTDEQITGVDSPFVLNYKLRFRDTSRDTKEFEVVLTGPLGKLVFNSGIDGTKNTPTCYKTMYTNDHSMENNYSPQAQEAEITELLAEVGVEVTFVD